MADELNTSAKETREQLDERVAQMVHAGKGNAPKDAHPLVCKPRELEPWRVFKIMSEFVSGFELLQKHATAATFFGSTRRGFEDHFYLEATELAGRLAKKGFSIITGGSTGIMEASNKGAFEAGGSSVGLNINLDSHQSTNHYLTETLAFDHFFVRKTMLTFASNAYVFFPGGFGTLDEFFEIITLIQTKKINKIPVVVYGREYWAPLNEFIEKKLLGEHGAIDKEDMDIYKVVDSVDEAYDYITKNVKC